MLVMESLHCGKKKTKFMSHSATLLPTRIKNSNLLNCKQFVLHFFPLSRVESLGFMSTCRNHNNGCRLLLHAIAGRQNTENNICDSRVPLNLFRGRTGKKTRKSYFCCVKNNLAKEKLRSWQASPNKDSDLDQRRAGRAFSSLP